MKANFLLSLVFALSGICLTGLATAQNAAAEPRTALLIGVSGYDDTYFAPLQSPKLDAEKMERQLLALGFEVQVLKNSKRRQIVEAIDQFGYKLTKRGGVGLFYYSGHGVQFDQQNYIVPKDTNIKTTRDLPEEAVPVQRVLNRMTDSKNRLNLVFLDACRNNAIPTEAKSSGGGGLAAMRGGSGLMVFFATQPGQVAFDSTEGTGSLFTSALLNHLKAPGVSLMDMMADVTAETETLSDKISNGREKQTPFVSGSLSGRFYFVPEGSAPPAPRAALVSDADAVQAVDIFHQSPYSAYNAYSKEVILRRVQSKLNATGYYLGAIDGKTGPALRQALIEYQGTFNLSTSSRLDRATLESLKLDGIKEQSVSDAARASSDEPQPQPKSKPTLSGRPQQVPSESTAPDLKPMDKPIGGAAAKQTGYLFTPRQQPARPQPTPAARPAPTVSSDDLDAKFRRAAEQFEKKF